VTDEHPESAQDRPSRARRSFGPVVLLGLAAAALAAVAGSKVWITGTSGDVSTDNPAFLPTTELAAAQESPLAAALALVLLACWGVLLVTRGVVRRGVAGLAAVASIALFVVTALAPGRMAADLTDLLTSVSAADTADTGLTAWYVAALVAAVASVLLSVVAVLAVGSWPEMGARYDAPTDKPSTAEPSSNLDLWKALDDGQDPTA
jgi:uncharacterized membrane protein (TIGR02234 family)